MTPEVRVSGGRVAGAGPDEHGGVHAFLGVPYAASPLVGDARLALPRPARWDGVRPALEPGPTAPQPAQGFTIIPEPTVPGEECLNLNVFTPDLGRGAGGLPVLVWIHGGGFRCGTPSSPWYHGRGFGRDGIVVVAISYRLGYEGFLTIDGAPTNRAVHDWFAALRWVQENVAAFGGDPGNVTIGGQSAGSVACATLLATPAARGLFRRAILMSGGVSHLRPIERSRRLAERLAEALGIPATRDGFASRTPAELVAAEALLRRPVEAADGPAPHPAVAQMSRALAGMPNGPVVDGDVLPEAPLDALRAGAAAGVDVLVGSTSEETVMAAQLADGVDDTVLLDALEATGVRAEAADAYRRAHPADAPAIVLGRASTDLHFRLPAMRLLEATAGPRTFGYEFRWPSPTGFGVVHCLDVPFAFGVLDAPAVDVVAGAAPPAWLGEDVHGAWARFVATGDPGWAPYDGDRRTVMAFGPERSAVVTDPHDLARRTFGHLV